MKIAIATLDADENAPISSVGARSPWILIFEDDRLIEKIKNPFTVGGGAGFGVANMLIEKGVEVFVAGKFGPNLQQQLESHGIKCIPGAGSAKEFLMKLQN